MTAETAVKPLRFEVEQEGDVAVVRCHGRLVAGLADGFCDEVRPVIEGSQSVVVDLEDLAYVDSMGVGALVRLYLTARRAGCEFKLRHVGKQVRNVLKLTNLMSVFSGAEDSNITIA